MNDDKVGWSGRKSAQLPTPADPQRPSRRSRCLLSTTSTAEHQHRVLVCGGRDYNYYSRIYNILDDIQDERGSFACIITGDATGADHWAESWAWMEKLRHLKFAADWTGYGTAAGPIRNQIMIEEGKPDLVVAFPGGRGTADMVRRARAAGIEVIKVARHPMGG